MDTGILTDNTTTCYHCGEHCSESTECMEGKYFCCEGCRMVYEILEEHELDTYYCLESNPGHSFREKRHTTRFDYLDDPTVVQRLIDFRNNDMISVSFHIPGIHCTSCVWLLEHLYRLDKRISKSSVHFMKRKLSISFDETAISFRSVVELLSSIGYEPELKLESLEKKQSASPDRRLWLKLGVAGFAFGNIMLFSFPEYLSVSTLSSQGSFHVLFGLLNIALSLPVLLYSAGDYLRSAWAAIRQGDINMDVPISIGLLALFTRSMYEIASGTGPGYLDSFTGLVFFLLIGRMIQHKAFERLSFDRDYKSYLPISVTIVQEDGGERSVSIDKLRKGDRILIRNGELVPADGVLLSENSFVDYSFITGEEDPREAKQGDTVYAGGKVIGPSAELNIVKEVSNSYLTKLWNNAAFEDSAENLKISMLADRISPHFTLAVMGIAVTAALMWWPVSSVKMSLSVFTAVLIIACPCALALSTPFTLSAALNILSQNGLFIKGIEVIERLSRAGSVVFDKTGTLTEPEQAEVTFRGEALSDYKLSLIKSACRQSVHPLSKKIVDSLHAHGTRPAEQFDEIVNKGIKARVEGHRVIIGSALFIAELLPEEHEWSIHEKKSRGVTQIHVAIDGQWKGWFEIVARYRPGIKDLLADLKRRFRIYLITGDNASQASGLTPCFEEHALRYSQTPQQKLDFIKELQEKGQRVIMIGDGLNDAGALQQSDFGIALTDHTSSFTPACDAIMKGSVLSKLNTFVDFSQKSIMIIKLSFGLSLIYNTVGLSFAVAGQLTPLLAAILMPLSSISIMVFTTGSTYLTAKKMGLTPWR